MQRAIFLDRDNTIIHNDGDLGDPHAVQLIDGAAEAMVALQHAGYLLVVVTNQSGVARGKFTEDDVKAVHREMDRQLEAATGRPDLVRAYYYCPWHPEGVLEEFRGDHPCRKPEPGMLLQAAADLELDLSRSWMVGDQPRDVAAGIAAGCRSILLGTGEPAAAACLPSLREAATFLLDMDETS